MSSKNWKTTSQSRLEKNKSLFMLKAYIFKFASTNSKRQGGAITNKST